MKFLKYIFLLPLVALFLNTLGLYLFKPADVRLLWDYVVSDFDSHFRVVSNDINKTFKNPQTYTIELSQARYYEIGFSFEDNSQESKPKASIGSVAIEVSCEGETVFKESSGHYVYGTYQSRNIDYLKKIAVARFSMNHLTTSDDCQLVVDMTHANQSWFDDGAKLYYSLSHYL